MATARGHRGENEPRTLARSCWGTSGFPAAVLTASRSLVKPSTARRQEPHSAICASACAAASADSSRSTIEAEKLDDAESCQQKWDGESRLKRFRSYLH